MKLYLVQHAKPKSETEDPKRLLADEGWADIRKVASFLSEHKNVKVTAIMHSGKTRAKQTAEVLAKYLKPSTGVKAADGLKPLDPVSIWIEQIKETKEDIVLVGHLPYMSKLAAYLLCQDENNPIVTFQMGGVVCLERDETGKWSIAWMVIPQIL